MAMADNIVLFITDDHGSWATGCYGNPDVRSPNLDELARTGVRFAHAFTPTPVCSPARACIMTGRIASQHGVHDWLREQEPAVGAIDWIAGVPTLAQHLARSGYTCIQCGKWHIGQSEQPHGGFHRWFAVGQPQGAHGGSQRYSDEGKIQMIKGFKTDVVTEHAVDFLRSDAAAEPFFLVVGYIGTHTPWKGHPERLAAAYRARDLHWVADAPPQRVDGGPGQGVDPREALVQYYAAVTHIDEGVGRVLDALEVAGLRERTTVVYTADHGLALGQRGIYGKGNGTLPKNMAETSIRVPLIWNHPGQLAQGAVVESLVDHCDLFCTLLDHAGVDAWRGDAALPGASYLPALRGEPLADWRDTYFGEFGPVRCIRTRDAKLVRRHGHGGDEWYDLDVDPLERDNRIDSPDPHVQARIAALDARMRAYFERYQGPGRSGLRWDPASRGVGADAVAAGWGV